MDIERKTPDMQRRRMEGGAESCSSTLTHKVYGIRERLYVEKITRCDGISNNKQETVSIIVEGVSEGLDLDPFQSPSSAVNAGKLDC